MLRSISTGLQAVLWTTFLASAGSAFAAGKATGEGPCDSGSECAGGTCVEVNGTSHCSQPCGTCPSGMICDGDLFRTVGLRVCLKQAALSSASPPQTPPRLPCRTDAECTGGLVCAEKMGRRDCALPCRSDAVCKSPVFAGMKMDFLACVADDAAPARRACLPKKACLRDPSSCLSVDPRGGMPFGAMAQDFEAPPSDAAPDLAPAPARAVGMSPRRFSEFLSGLQAIRFDDERMEYLKSVVPRNHMTAAQVGRVVESLRFGDEKVGAVRILAPQIVDLENGHTILQYCRFDDEKTAIRKILAAQ